jgi:hypothetical protein
MSEDKVSVRELVEEARLNEETCCLLKETCFSEWEGDGWDLDAGRFKLTLGLFILLLWRLAVWRELIFNAPRPISKTKPTVKTAKKIKTTQSPYASLL